MINFWKYSATGNDFILFDDRNGDLPILDWEKLCDREAGLGADGVLILENSESEDFKMTYLNADGGEVEMCGNGGRAISHFALQELGITPKNNNNFSFETREGKYFSSLEKNFVRLNMTEFSEWKKIDISGLYPTAKSIYMKTGVPHCIFLVDSVDTIELDKVCPPIRRHEMFEKGCNVNFVEVIADSHIKMRTFERGVEGETLACGTGATAAALGMNDFFGWKDEIIIDAPGGKLEIQFKGENGQFSDIYLCGKVEKITSGSFDLKKFGRA